WRRRAACWPAPPRTHNDPSVPAYNVFYGDYGMAPRTMIGWIVMGSLLLPTATLRADEQADDYLRMVVGLLGEKDTEFRAAGLDHVRSSAKAPWATKLFAAQLPKLDAAAQ